MGATYNGQEITPNLNKLAKEGLFFSNYYPQVSVGTSSDTEFTFNTSLLPASTGTVFVNYWKRTYEAMPNLLKQKGYYTASMHANNASFWNRNVMHETLGYNKFYAKDSFDYTDSSTIMGMGLSDKEFFRQATNKIKNISEKNNNYFVTLITLTNHTPWDDEDKYGNYSVDYKYTETDQNGNTVQKSLPYLEGSELGRYFKSVHYADSAIGDFINELDQNGLLDNTVVVIYGDHDAKISKKQYKNFYNYDFETSKGAGENKYYDSSNENYVDVDYYNYELNRKVPFIIWTKDQDLQSIFTGKVTYTMGMYNVAATILNMYGIYNKYNIGEDIFTVKDDNLVVYPNGNILTNKVYYNNSTGEYKVLKEDNFTEDYIKNLSEIGEKRLEISNDIIVYNLLDNKKMNGE